MNASSVILSTIDLTQSPESRARLTAFLSPEESARAARFGDELSRQYFIACRARVREILGDHLGEHPARLVIMADANGKPFLPKHYGVHFNISHTGAAAVLAIAGSPVGVDIEKVRPLQEDVAARFFHQGEIDALAQWSGDEYWAAFYRVWTKKESFLKALGQGLRLPLDAFQLPAVPGAFHRLVSCAFDPGACARFCIADFTLNGAIQGALCLETPESAFSLTISTSPANGTS